MGHRVYGKASKVASEPFAIRMQASTDHSEIIEYLKTAGAHGIVETELGITTILINHSNRSKLQKTVISRWGSLPGFQLLEGPTNRSTERRGAR